MTDTAKLREALETPGPFSGPRTPEQSRLVYDAAEKYLTIREAGALIITPDEKTVELIAHQICSVINPELPYRRAPSAMRSTCRQEARNILDALRDAMPDGDSQ